MYQEHTIEKCGQMQVGELYVKYGAVFGGRPGGYIIKRNTLVYGMI